MSELSREELVARVAELKGALARRTNQLDRLIAAELPRDRIVLTGQAKLVRAFEDVPFARGLCTTLKTIHWSRSGRVRR